MNVNLTTLLTAAVLDSPTVARRQVTLTQTITYPDSTTTAVVTLDRGGPPTDSPAPNWSAGAVSSDGLGQQQIGIVVGCCIGAVVLGIIIWCCCTGRCGCAPYRTYENPHSSDEYFYTEITRPQRTYFPRFPQSIPPPSTPSYTARDSGNGPLWQASYDASTRTRHYY
ncbi:hypothetical protein GGR54DRAFT_642437 [Hypoxylon sp. NC1633]|nr:hypothetical protein GGR54DRAFT_642437 [Hypoxylon sp. NC1633]